VTTAESALARSGPGADVVRPAQTALVAGALVSVVLCFLRTFGSSGRFVLITGLAPSSLPRPGLFCVQRTWPWTRFSIFDSYSCCPTLLWRHHSQSGLRRVRVKTILISRRVQMEISSVHLSPNCPLPYRCIGVEGYSANIIMGVFLHFIRSFST